MILILTSTLHLSSDKTFSFANTSKFYYLIHVCYPTIAHCYIQGVHND